MRYLLPIIFLSLFHIAYGRDNTVTSLIHDDLMKDEHYVRYANITKNVYVWEEKTVRHLLLRGREKERKKEDDYVKEKLGCNTIDTISIQSSKYKFHFKPVKNLNKKWCKILEDRNFSKRSIIIIKLSDIYQCHDAISYCLIQVYVMRKCYEYEYLLKKENGQWIIVQKHCLSDYIL